MRIHFTGPWNTRLLPAYLLTEQKRMPAGMMHLSNDFIYGSKLKDGRGAALTGLADAQALKAYLAAMYPSLKPEPEEIVYPIMLNIHGETSTEHKGTSVFNTYNVAATLDEIVKLLQSHPPANCNNVAIATPYRAQLRKYRRALQKAHKRFPELKMDKIRIGTAAYWQGKELSYMFVDLVRASNDAAALDFVSDARRLNVLVTRQTLGFWLVGDERCVLTLGQQAERDNPYEDTSSNANESQQPNVAAVPQHDDDDKAA
ncbi:hypothetical protein IMSHALPRED_008224 [Imshaugia aleurites]|uniref:DNA2/NAM7 helicase-like C-terminal domain-containing protein n=1 Tax=Imshaugia aleurites TaxID=172621 RepID=A0A8H3IRF7_9LECA|nr:hypothetical protein IMSHALPRED_008224 [Imshaugia aleurites]